VKKTTVQRMAFVFALAITPAMLLTAAFGFGAPKEPSFTIKLPHIYQDAHFEAIAFAEFAKNVESRSNGTLKVMVYSNSTLANEDQIYEGLRNGTYEMGVMGIICQDRLPAVAALQLPFLFKDIAQARRALYDHDYGLQLTEGAAGIGVKMLRTNVNGLRIISGNRKLEKIEDFKGFKIRTANFKNMIHLFELLGCTVTPMAITEVFSALEQKVVDGCENPPVSMQTSGFYEVQDYLLMSNHTFSPDWLCVNLAFWNKLSQNQKDIITKAADECSAQIWSAAEKQQEVSIKTMQEKKPGLKILYPSDEFHNAMVKATMPMYDDLYKNAPKAKAIVEAMQALVK
jgi:TRAP-type transport system periplasmic protein